MKKLFTIAAILFISLSSTASYARDVVITVSFDIGRPKFHCERGIWFCNVKGDVQVSTGPSAKVVYDMENGLMTFNFNSELDEEARRQGYFFAESGEEVVLPADVCRKLGANVQIVPGKYVIDFTASTFGSVTVRTEPAN